MLKTYVLKICYNGDRDLNPQILFFQAAIKHRIAIMGTGEVIYNFGEMSCSSIFEYVYWLFIGLILWFLGSTP